MRGRAHQTSVTIAAFPTDTRAVRLISWKKGHPLQDGPEFQGDRSDQPFTASFSAFAMVTFTALSAGLVMVSPVAGLRT